MIKAYGIGGYYSEGMKSSNPHSGIYEADTARTLDCVSCGYPACNQGGVAIVQDFEAVSIGNGQAHELAMSETARTLNCMHDQQDVIVSGGGVAVDCRNGTESEVNGTLQSGGFRNVNSCNTVRNQMVVRRLTPLECERLQGFPDGWTLIGEPEEKEVIDYAYTYGEEGNEVDRVEVGRHTEIEYFYTDANGKRKKCTDSARYKALGNSIALPPWKWVLKRICACYERDATMASLFDGIGGFPLIWEQLNGKGSCLWASEIEEFPIAVTKLRFE